MANRGWAVLLLIAGLLVSAPAMAQEQSGSIQGVVKDSSGGVLPGVTVEARSPALVGVGSTVTDATGTYRFPALPPGRYEVTANLSGFGPGRVADIDLRLGALLKVDLALSIAGLSETVQVTGESPLIDVKQNASFANIQQDVIDRIPKGRNFTDVVSLAPGANNESYSGGIQVDGASGSENRFVVDGMDTTALRSGTSNKTVLIDFIQEVQVKSSGYNAEFGGATGGVISAITKSGSNNFRGSAGTYFQNDSMRYAGDERNYLRINPIDDRTPQTVLIGNTSSGSLGRGDKYMYLSPVMDLGGPIMRDKLWFYGGYAWTGNMHERDVKFWNSPTKEARSFDWDNKTNYANWNVSTQLNSDLRLKFSGANTWTRNRGTAPALQPRGHAFSDGTPADGYTTATWSADQARMNDLYENVGSDSTNHVFSANVDWVITPTFFMNVTGGSYTYDSYQPEAFAGTQLRHIFGTSNMNYLPGVIPDNLRNISGYDDFPKSSSRTEKAFYGRYFLNANSTWFKNWKGQHTVKVGMRYERLANQINDGEQFPRIHLYWNQTRATSDGRSVRGDYGYYRVRQIATTGDVSSNNFGFWVQDSWTVNNNLTINAGLRTENENVPSYSTGDGIKFGFREKMAPRVGFAYDVQGNNKWKLYGSYGKFFDITKLSLPIGAFGGDKWVDHYFTLDTFNWPTITCTDGVTAAGCTGGTKIESVDMRFNSSAINPVLTAYFGEPRNTIDPDLKPYETGELTFGLDHELNRTMSVGVRYVHKWLVRAIEDVGVLIPEIGEVYFISNPGFGISKVMDPEYPSFVTPKADRDYDSVEFRLRKRMADRWSFEGTYVWSYLRGNYSGLASSDEGGRTDPNVSRYFDAPYMSYDKNGDEVYGRLYTDRPHQVKLTGTYDLPWGTSVGVSSVIQSGLMPSSLIYWNGYDVYYNGRGDMARTPTTSMFDMMLQHDFRLFKTHRINVHLQIDNVFDQKGVTDVWQRKYRDNFYGDDTFYGGFDPDVLAAQMIANKETQRLHPLYGQPYSYQAPRAMRLGVKYTF